MELLNKNTVFKKILKNKIFSRNHHQLENALKTHRLLPYNFIIQRVPPKLKFENTKKKKSKSMENSNHPANILDDILVEGEHQFEKNKELFQNYKIPNDLFVKHYKLLVKSTSENNPKNNNLNENQKDSYKNKENIDNLFKSNGILLKEPTDLYFYYLYISKNKKIKVLKEKSVKYLERIKDFLINDSKDQNFYSKNENDKQILKEDIKSIEKKKKDLKDFIFKTKQSLKSIYENKNYLDDCSDKKIHKLNKTSSSGFFSQNEIYKNYYNCLQDNNSKKHSDIPLIINKNNINKPFEKEKKLSKKKNSSSNCTFHLKKNNEHRNSLFSTKIKYGNLTPHKDIEFYYEKIKANPKLNEEEINNVGGLLHDNNIPVNLNGNKISFQLYKTIKNTQGKLNNFNVQDSIRKIFVHKIPNHTKKKFGELDEVENKINNFEGKLYKCVLEVN